jgi:hypothetical protein
MAHGVLYTTPVQKPLNPLTSQAQLLPLASYVFYLTGGTVPSAPFTSGDLTSAFASNTITADANGTFPAIFLDPTKVYRVLMYDQFNRKIMDVDPYVSAITTFGTSQLTINIVTGQVEITQTQPGGSGAALTVIAKNGGIALDTGAAGFQVGVAELQLLNTGYTGSITANFPATNKPGVANGGVNQWMPINVNGALFYIPLWI